jgi:hypothetical protein
MDQHLSPTETARRFGVSITALRLYEQRGLLKPARTRNGSTGSAWRVYGPDPGRAAAPDPGAEAVGPEPGQDRPGPAKADTLGSVLALQEEALAREGVRLARALSLVRAARAKMASGEALSIDDLANLTKETVMTVQDRKELFEQTFARHFNAEERDLIRRNRAAVLEDWKALKPELEKVMAAGNPASPAARAVVGRCREISGRMHGADGDMRARFQAFRDAVASDPELSGLMAVTPEMNAFIKKAAAATK